MFRFLQRLEREFAWDCGKALKEIFESFSTLQIVELRLDRHPGTSKNRRAVYYVGMTRDRLLDRIIVSQLLFMKKAAMAGRPEVWRINLPPRILVSETV